MAIKGLEGMTPQQLQAELAQGGRFVVFLYTISVLIMTFKRGSDVHFVRAGQGSVGPGIPYTLVTVLLGWWGIPWGPIYSIESIVTNVRGGKDVTKEIAAAMGVSAPAAAVQPAALQPR